MLLLVGWLVGLVGWLVVARELDSYIDREVVYILCMV